MLHSTRTRRGGYLTTIFPSSFTQNALFSSSCPGLGRGSMDQITLGGKSISLNKLSKRTLDIGPKSDVKINVFPGQFDDAIEERKKMFQSLAEPIQDPLKKLYEERQASSPPLKREININRQQQQQRRSNQHDLGAYKKEMERTGSSINQRAQPERERERQVKLSARKSNQKKNYNRSLQQTDFVAQDINWSDFTHLNTNELDQTTKEEEEEQEALRLESEGGDYDRYLSFPKSIQEKFNLDNYIANSLQKVIGQNPSYKLPEKKLVYETLFQNLNTSMQPHRNKNKEINL